MSVASVRAALVSNYVHDQRVLGKYWINHPVPFDDYVWKGVYEAVYKHVQDEDSEHEENIFDRHQELNVQAGTSTAKDVMAEALTVRMMQAFNAFHVIYGLYANALLWMNLEGYVISTRLSATLRFNRLNSIAKSLSGMHVNPDWARYIRDSQRILYYEDGNGRIGLSLPQYLPAGQFWVDNLATATAAQVYAGYSRYPSLLEMSAENPKYGAHDPDNGTQGNGWPGWENNRPITASSGAHATQLWTAIDTLTSAIIANADLMDVMNVNNPLSGVFQSLLGCTERFDLANLADGIREQPVIDGAEFDQKERTFAPGPWPFYKPGSSGNAFMIHWHHSSLGTPESVFYFRNAPKNYALANVTNRKTGVDQSNFLGLWMNSAMRAAWINTGTFGIDYDVLATMDGQPVPDMGDGNETIDVGGIEWAYAAETALGSVMGLDMENGEYQLDSSRHLFNRLWSIMQANVNVYCANENDMPDFYRGLAERGLKFFIVPEEAEAGVVVLRSPYVPLINRTDLFQCGNNRILSYGDDNGDWKTHIQTGSFFQRGSDTGYDLAFDGGSDDPITDHEDECYDTYLYVGDGLMLNIEQYFTRYGIKPASYIELDRDEDDTALAQLRASYGGMPFKPILPPSLNIRAAVVTEIRNMAGDVWDTDATQLNGLSRFTVAADQHLLDMGWTWPLYFDEARPYAVNIQNMHAYFMNNAKEVIEGSYIVDSGCSVPSVSAVTVPILENVLDIKFLKGGDKRGERKGQRSSSNSGGRPRRRSRSRRPKPEKRPESLKTEFKPDSIEEIGDSKGFDKEEKDI
jgi:hypothetical protein